MFLVQNIQGQSWNLAFKMTFTESKQVEFNLIVIVIPPLTFNESKKQCLFSDLVNVSVYLYEGFHVLPIKSTISFLFRKQLRKHYSLTSLILC